MVLHDAVTLRHLARALRRAADIFFRFPQDESGPDGAWKSEDGYKALDQEGGWIRSADEPDQI
jgi:hypothetical protein